MTRRPPSRLAGACAIHRIAVAGLVALGLATSACTSTAIVNTPPDALDCDANVAACGGCVVDTQCPAANPRCDTKTNRCVPCLPTSDNCTGGQHCVPKNDSYVCAPGCSPSVGCPKSDAGAAMECCAGVCLDTSLDRDNCGACGKACAPVMNGVAACVAGACVVGSCGAGFADCNSLPADGCEVSTATDAKNCGACAKVCPAGPNSTTSCAAGQCQLACGAGFAHCSGNPTDGCETSTLTDANNCGKCGHSCSGLPNATATCSAGACVISLCQGTYADCNGKPDDGCEADRSTDVNNCGTCGKVCALPGATAKCQVGICSIGACSAGRADCNGNAADGCEIATDSDVKNCGGCGVTCTAANGTAACVAGKCTIASCAVGYADCDGSIANGCEAQPATDPKNCGTCGKACPAPANSTATCVAGVCGAGPCKFGYADCNSNAADGCEASLLSPNTCGTCTIKCTAPANATAGCNTGTCGIGMCNALFGDCNSNPSDGCEKSLATDLANCGGCGQVCAPSNATASCLGGVCGYLACSAGFADCDSVRTNGCESQIASDPKNCGGCGKACPTPAFTNAACTNTVCSWACQAGHADCDKVAANGCEVTTATDVNNCGACGAVCAAVANGTPGCTSGFCSVASCRAGFGDCNFTYADGCEKALTTDVNNCGACGKVCSFPHATAGCLNSTCGILSCSTGFSDCNSSATDGCEAYLSGDANNCGMCGRKCGGTTPFCQGGTCIASQCKPATGVKSIAADPNRLYGFCWYLGAAGLTCDQVCSELGGSNLANNALNAFPDSCTLPAATDVTTWFYNNGNAAGWTSGSATSRKTLGHGYVPGDPTFVGYIGKCSTGTYLPGQTGTFPGEMNDGPTRTVVCPCF